MAGTLNMTPFRPSYAGSSSPTVSSTLGSTSQFYALQSTGVREWQYPSNRSILVTSLTGDDYWIDIGSSDVVASSTGKGIPVLGGTAQVFSIDRAAYTHFAVASSTSVAVFVTIGHGY